MDTIMAEFTTRRVRIQLVCCDNGKDGYIVFTRVLDNWDLDDVDCYNKKENAVARYLFLISRMILETPYNS